MFQTIAETPLALVSIGGLFTACMVAFYFQSRDKRLVPLIAFGAFLTLLPAILASLIVTEREQIKETVYRMANCVRQNDVTGLLTFVDSAATGVAARISREMPTYTFSACNVAGFEEVTIDENDTSQALVRFNVFVNVHAPRYDHHGPALRSVKLKFQKQADGSWKASEFSHFPPKLLQ